MSRNKYNIVFIIIPVVLIPTFVLTFDHIDPYMRTDDHLKATVTHGSFGTGKTGTWSEINVLTAEDRVIVIKVTADSDYKVGSQIKLVKYKRQLTGLIKYELY